MRNECVNYLEVGINRFVAGDALSRFEQLRPIAFQKRLGRINVIVPSNGAIGGLGIKTCERQVSQCCRGISGNHQRLQGVPMEIGLLESIQIWMPGKIRFDESRSLPEPLAVTQVTPADMGRLVELLVGKIQCSRRRAIPLHLQDKHTLGKR